MANNTNFNELSAGYQGLLTQFSESEIHDTQQAIISCAALSAAQDPNSCERILMIAARIVDIQNEMLKENRKKPLTCNG